MTQAEIYKWEHEKRKLTKLFSMWLRKTWVLLSWNDAIIFLLLMNGDKELVDNQFFYWDFCTNYLQNLFSITLNDI